MFRVWMPLLSLLGMVSAQVTLEPYVRDTSRFMLPSEWTITQDA